MPHHSQQMKRPVLSRFHRGPPAAPSPRECARYSCRFLLLGETMTSIQPNQTDDVRGPAFDKTTPSILDVAHRWLTLHNIAVLRVSMGAIIFGYGILKYFPGISPAQNLVQTTMHLLTFGLVPDNVTLVLVATLECTIGLSLMIGRGMQVTIYLLVFWVLGTLSPVVLLPQRLFAGPDHAPTLEGQYVLKDIVFLAASLVIATTLRQRNHDAEARPTHDISELQ